MEQPTPELTRWSIFFWGYAAGFLYGFLFTLAMMTFVERST